MVNGHVVCFTTDMLNGIMSRAKQITKPVACAVRSKCYRSAVDVIREMTARLSMTYFVQIYGHNLYCSSVRVISCKRECVCIVCVYMDIVLL